MGNSLKIVYVLVSGESDYFYEQTLISASSARHWNPEAKIVVVMDDRTDSTLIGRRTSLLEVADQKVVVQLPANMNNKRRSRILKTSVRDLVVGDFIYIDSDTVICQPLPSLNQFRCEIGAVLDRHVYLQRERDYLVLQRVKLLGGTFSDGEAYYNSGVLIVKDTEKTHSFFSDWKALYEKGVAVGQDFDQPALLLCNQKHNLIEAVDGIYNCQIFTGGLPYLGDAIIIHAFNIFGYSSFFLFNDSKFLQKIREQGKLAEEELKCVEEPKRQFRGEYALLYGDMMGFYQSSLFHLYNDSLTCFRFVERVGKFLLLLSRKFGK